ncbi:MAG TPA: hypothetical protein DEH78_21340 [Solibacterales bacterium]|nr:hypothetical protein [Bryobacterales bacterium]
MGGAEVALFDHAAKEASEFEAGDAPAARAAGGAATGGNGDADNAKAGEGGAEGFGDGCAGAGSMDDESAGRAELPGEGGGAALQAESVDTGWDAFGVDDAPLVFEAEAGDDDAVGLDVAAGAALDGDEGGAILILVLVLAAAPAEIEPEEVTGPMGRGVEENRFSEHGGRRHDGLELQGEDIIGE